MTIKCPNCGVELVLPDGLEEGQKIQCTVCQTKFFLGTNQEKSFDSLNRACNGKTCAFKLKDFWQQKAWCRNIIKVVGAVCLLKVVAYIAGVAGTVFGNHAAEVDKVALSEMLRVADQHGDWIAFATNNFDNTSQEYQNFVFDLIGSAGELSGEFLKTKKIYEELNTVGGEFMTSVSQIEEWDARMNASIAACRIRSKSIVLKAKADKTSPYYKTRKRFLVGMYYLISKHLEKYESMVSVVSDTGQYVKRYSNKENKTKAEEKIAKEEFQKLLVRAEKIEQEIRNINSATVKDDELEKMMMDYE